MGRGARAYGLGAVVWAGRPRTWGAAPGPTGWVTSSRQVAPDAGGARRAYGWVTSSGQWGAAPGPTGWVPSCGQVAPEQYGYV